MSRVSWIGKESCYDVIDPRFLFDTNILIYLVAGAINPLRARVETLQPGEAVTSTICVAEAAVGLRESDQKARNAMDRLYRVIEPLAFDRVAAERFGDLPYRRGNSDRLIAAHALSLDLTLVTNNESDFAGIPGLRVENWTR